ncbi:MAG TPA: DUF6151 family protein [Enhygromyxa sp.]|nr:DUF6151 family protein [Enhygromyxa sp.]
MSRDIPLRCACGSVTGVASNVDPDRGNRVVCMCDDCQAYAHWLDRADAILDPNGGTDVFQLLPAQVRITAGHEHVRCVRLSDKGLMRWYAGCCKTPIGNTLASPRGPFIGVPHTFWDHASDGRSRDEALGPILSRTQARYGKPPLPPDSHPSGPLWLIARFGWQLLRGLFTGGYKPSPVFDASGKPIVEPTIVSPDDRERLRALCGPG